MGKNNGVIFKGTKDGIIVLLDDKPDFDTIMSNLRNKVTDAKKFFGDETAAISFKGRTLTEIQEEKLLNIICEACNLNISFVKNDGEAVLYEKPLDIPDEKVDEAFYNDEVFYVDELISADENKTIYHKGSLRSGQMLSYDGSICVIGDINPGSEIYAEGNIIVMGSIKGLVHAGCKGNPACFVAALNLQPIQLRIAETITYIPKEMKNAKQKLAPAMAYIDEESKKIFIAPLVDL